MTDQILPWLSTHPMGWYDPESIGIKDYSDIGMGMGAIALKDLEVSLRVVLLPGDSLSTP
jgi:hypothetical protein